MHISSRSHLTAGIAALGVGALALAPIQPLPGHTAALAPQRVVENLAVELTAAVDPITLWVETLQTTGANIGKLFEFYLERPFPLLQTIGANLGTYFEELGNGNAGLIPGQIWGNIQKFFLAPWDPGTCATDPCSDPALYEGDYISNVPITNEFILGRFSQRELYQTLPLVLADDPDLLTTLAPLLGFAATTYSGQLAGLVGPLLAPLVVLTRSFTAIGEYFEAGDVQSAIFEILNIPANLFNGVMNGAGYLDLTGVVNAIQPLPDTIKAIGLNLGGLVSPPVPFEGTLAEPTALNGGVLFDNIAVDAAVDLGFASVEVKSPGLPVSWFGSVIGLGQFLGDQLLVTPPAPPPVAEAETAKLAAPVDVAPPALTEAPAEDAAPADEVAADEVAVDEVAADEAATDDLAVDALDEQTAADLEAAEVAAADEAAVEAAEDEPAATPGADESDDTGSRAGDSRRGASDAD
jgi:hypothetical protein